MTFFFFDGMLLSSRGILFTPQFLRLHLLNEQIIFLSQNYKQLDDFIHPNEWILRSGGINRVLQPSKGDIIGTRRTHIEVNGREHWIHEEIIRILL